jgi:hypothetical protein
VERPSSAGTTSSGAIGTSGADESREPVPYERFQEVNGKYTKLKWAEDFGDEDPETIRGQVALARWARDDPRGFNEFYQSQLRANGYVQDPPQQRANGHAEPEGPPGPDYRDPATGLTVYSAEQHDKSVRYYVDQLRQELSGRIAPAEQFAGTMQMQMAARNEASQILRDAKTWPGFEANQPAIFDQMRKNPRLSIEAAYRRVVIPTFEARARQDVIASTEAKTGATTISPSSAQGSGREDLSKLPFRTLVAREARKRGWGK